MYRFTKTIQVVEYTAITGCVVGARFGAHTAKAPPGERVSGGGVPLGMAKYRFASGGELGGIEPPSENHCRADLHGLAG